MRLYIAIAVVFTIVLVVPSVAYNVGVSSKTFQFSHAVQMKDEPGTVVFYLTNGSAIAFQNEKTREGVQPLEMLTWGSIVVGYSFIGWPVSVQYLNSTS